MLALRYERRHKVLAITVTGVLSSEDLADHDRLVLRFLAGKDGVRGLYDLSKVDAVAVPVSRINQRGQRPPIIDGMRVMVAPGGAAGLAFIRSIADQLGAAGHREPRIAETLEDAYRLLDLVDPRFEPVEPVETVAD